MSVQPPSCDVAAAFAAPAGRTRHPNWTLLATILASSLAFIDGSVVNVALSAIGRSFSAGPADLQWTINAYLLPLAALLLLGGAAGDHFGRRRLLIGGTALFALASLFCAFAPNPDLLLAARALQGVGAAVLMPNSLAILGQAFEGEARGRAIGTWAAAGAIAHAVGPPLGGWLVEVVGWRAIFLLNLPVAAAAMLVAWRFVEESGEGDLPLDWRGAVLATLALGALTWALTLWSAHGRLSPAVIIGVLLGSIAIAGFLRHEHAVGSRAMMPVALFASRPFVGLSLTTLLLYGALSGALLLLPYVLITGGGYTPLQAGLSLLPLPLVIGSTSRLMGRISGKLGPRWPLTVGPVVAGGGFALLARADLRGAYLTSVLPGVAVLAVGMAGAVAPLTTAVLASVDRHHAGAASGFNSAISRIGGLIATALAGAVIAQSAEHLTLAFGLALWLCAGLAVVGGLAAFLTLGGLDGPASPPSPRP